MKILRSLATVVAICLGTILSMGQGIEFMPEGSQFSDALAKAKAEGKLVFLDCYTSWCGPCKYMSSKVFTTQEAGDFMNPSYVCIKIDMEQGEGPALARKLEIAAYPTFIIFNSDGTEVGRFMGSCKPDEFVANVKTASSDNGLPEMQSRYEGGERDTQFLIGYIDTLAKAYKKRQAVEVAEVLLADNAETFAADPSLVKIFMEYITNPFNPSFVYTAKNPAAFKAAVGDRAAASKIRNVWERYLLTLVKEDNGNVTFDNETFTRLIDLMKECKVAGAERYRYTGLINYARRAGDWNAYMDNVEDYASNPAMDMDDMTIIHLATPVFDKCKDNAPRLRMKAIVDKRLEAISSGAREAQTRLGQRVLDPAPLEVLQKLSTDLATPANS